MEDDTERQSICWKRLLPLKRTFLNSPKKTSRTSARTGKKSLTVLTFTALTAGLLEFTVPSRPLVPEVLEQDLHSKVSLEQKIKIMDISQTITLQIGKTKERLCMCCYCGSEKVSVGENYEGFKTI